MKSSLKTPRMWIDGRIYEIKRLKLNNGKYVGKKEEEESCPKDNTKNIDYTEFYNLHKNDDGKLATKFRLPENYYRQLKNFSSPTIKDLEKSTETNIFIPTLQDMYIEITGLQEENIIQARDELHSIINEIRSRSSAMQFVSIPLKSEEIKENFKKFKELLAKEDIKNFDDSIFMAEDKLHATVCVLRLMDRHEEQEAVKALEDYKKTILDPLISQSGSFKIKVSGVECMKENWKKTDVVYANLKIIDESGKTDLQRFVNDISEYFYQRGLVQRPNEDDVKLHMTLINTKYRYKNDKSTDRKKRRWTKRESIDASIIMEKYKDFYFGECNVDSIQLSLMSSVGEDGYYKPLATINIP